MELDKACKDKKHKTFAPDFAVELVFEEPEYEGDNVVPRANAPSISIQRIVEYLPGTRGSVATTAGAVDK